MRIGDLIKYIRSTSKRDIEEGEGYLKAFGLDHENRIIGLVQDKDSGNTFHVFEKALNPSDSFKTAFKKLVQDVLHIETTGNEQIKEITDKANKDIGNLHNNVLGEPVDIPESTTQEV